jgi:hypothetical protein
MVRANLPEVNYGDVSNNNQWGMTIGDYDNDGHKDVFSGGSYDGVHVKHIDAVGQWSDFDLANGSMFHASLQLLRTSTTMASWMSLDAMMMRSHAFGKEMVRHWISMQTSLTSPIMITATIHQPTTVETTERFSVISITMAIWI